MKSVGSYEAKTHLPRLLDEVAKGEHLAITRHGVPVAFLVPATKRPRLDPEAVVEAFRELRKGTKVGGLTIRDLIGEGRRF